MSFLFCPLLLFGYICQCFGQLSTANQKRCPFKLKQKRCSRGDGVGPAMRQKQIHDLDLGGVKESQPELPLLFTVFVSTLTCEIKRKASCKLYLDAVTAFRQSGGWHRCTIAAKAHDVACVTEMILKKSDGSDQKTLICNSCLPLSPSGFQGVA